jgi:hypothetical protein
VIRLVRAKTATAGATVYRRAMKRRAYPALILASRTRGTV